MEKHFEKETDITNSLDGTNQQKKGGSEEQKLIISGLSLRFLGDRSPKFLNSPMGLSRFSLLI